MRRINRRRLLSSLMAPLVVLVVVPALVVWLTYSQRVRLPEGPWATAVAPILGAGLIVLGLVLLVATIRLFNLHGDGTIMPWDPTRELVVKGIYRHVRNPMHSGVFLVLFGEGLLLRSAAILLFAAAAVLLHLFYIPLSEERGLEVRFGEAYRVYRQNVPRWIPRLTPWIPENRGG